MNSAVLHYPSKTLSFIILDPSRRSNLGPLDLEKKSTSRRFFQIGPRTMNNTDRFLKWTETMEARPNQCWSVAMKYFDARTSNDNDEKAGYHRFDPDLTIAGQPLQYLGDGDFRYLGRPRNVHGSEELARSTITSKLDEWLQLVDNQTLPNTSKLWLYQHFIIPKLSWYLTALDLTLTFVKRLRRRQQNTCRSGLASLDQQTLRSCSWVSLGGLVCI